MHEPIAERREFGARVRVSGAPPARTFHPRPPLFASTLGGALGSAVSLYALFGGLSNQGLLLGQVLSTGLSMLIISVFSFTASRVRWRVEPGALVVFNGLRTRRYGLADVQAVTMTAEELFVTVCPRPRLREGRATRSERRELHFRPARLRAAELPLLRDALLEQVPALGYVAWASGLVHHAFAHPDRPPPASQAPRSIAPQGADLVVSGPGGSRLEFHAGEPGFQHIRKHLLSAPH